MTWVLGKTEFCNVKCYVVFLLEESSHSVVAEVAVFHLSLVGLVVGAKSSVEVVRHVVDTTFECIDSNVGAL